MALDIQMLDLLGDDGKLSAKMKDLAERQARADRTLEQATEQNRQAEDRRAQAAKMLGQAESKLAEANVARERANETERRAAEAHAELDGERADVERRHGASANDITAMTKVHEGKVAQDRAAIVVEREAHNREMALRASDTSTRAAEVTRGQEDLARARVHLDTQQKQINADRAAIERDRAEHAARIEQLRKLLP